MFSIVTGPTADVINTSSRQHAVIIIIINLLSTQGLAAFFNT